MRLPPAPLRFLATIVGGWVLVRGALLMPTDWMTGVAEAEQGKAAAPVPVAAEPIPSPAMASGSASDRLPNLFIASTPTAYGAPGLRVPASGPPAAMPVRLAVVAGLGAPMAIPAAQPTAPVARDIPFIPMQPATIRPRGDRLAVSGWLLLRRGEQGLAPDGGTLGASQAGLRLTYRIAGGRDTPLALGLRLTAALDRPAQSEAALGLDWRPIRGVPVHLLAERRQAIGREGRSDFSLTMHGGGTQRLGPVTAEGYAQAGIVGRDAFADGALRVTRTVGPFEMGGGAWGGAQPGATRVDIGPHVSARLPVAAGAIRAAAEWRFRVAGDAAPASGPAFTLATDF